MNASSHGRGFGSGACSLTSQSDTCHAPLYCHYPASKPALPDPLAVRGLLAVFARASFGGLTALVEAKSSPSRLDMSQSDGDIGPVSFTYLCGREGAAMRQVYVTGLSMGWPGSWIDVGAGSDGLGGCSNE